jgi:hypothetical protein
MDLLSQDNVDQFRAAMRSVTDTFHKFPATIRRESGEEIDLLAGLTADDTGTYGETDGERYVQADHAEMVERWVVTFNRDYLAEKGLIDGTTGKPLINPDDWIVITGKRFAIVQLTDKALFRGVPILVRLIVQR